MNPSPYPECNIQKANDVSGITLIEDVKKIDITDKKKVAYVTQTTLSVDDTRAIIAELKARYPNISGPDVRDICYATQNRQLAVREIAMKVDVMIVVGAQNSSNSNRLREIGDELNVPSYLIDDVDGLDLLWIDGAETVGISAGASAPEELVEELVGRLQEEFIVQLDNYDGVEENVQFKLPEEITGLGSSAIPSAKGN